MDSQKVIFAQARFGRIIAGLPFDTMNLMDEAQHFAWEVVRITIFVGAQTDSQVACLTNVQDAIGWPEHNVDSGAARHGFEEIGAEALKKRPRVLE